MTPDISVVMPVWNRRDGVKQAIQSIYDQSFTNWELIAVDDGSDDGTLDEVRRYSKADARVRSIRLDHTGRIGLVRNTGNLAARGELIVVQDSDDASLPNRLERIWETYKETNADVIYHGSYFTYWDERLRVNIRKWQPALPYSKEHLLQKQYIPGQIAYKRGVWYEHPYDARIYCCDDWQLLIEFALNDCSFAMIPDGLYEYWYHDGSVNVAGEKDGRRKHDLQIIIDILKTKYGADVAKFDMVRTDRKTGKTLSHEEVT